MYKVIKKLHIIIQFIFISRPTIKIIYFFKYSEDGRFRNMQTFDILNLI